MRDTSLTGRRLYFTLREVYKTVSYFVKSYLVELSIKP